MVASSGSSSARFHGDDRFYSPPALRRLNEQQQQSQKVQNQQQQPPMQRPARSKPRPSPPAASAPVESREVAVNRAQSDESSSKPSVPPLPASPQPTLPPTAGNLDRLLTEITPVVPAQYSSKVSPFELPQTSVRDLRNGSTALHYQPYFCLGDLWENFKEWSAYGAGVPLVLNGVDSVVQYYVPYLSAVQIFVDASNSRLSSRGAITITEYKCSYKLTLLLVVRQDDDESDGDHCLDTSSDGSCSSVDRIQQRFASLETTNHNAQGGPSDDGNAGTPLTPAFQYLERDPPYGREPLANKARLVNALASKFPRLKTYKSCDLHSSSWMSVAWYPIYRIPTGPTLKDLDACFLTFHHLATPKHGTIPQSADAGARSVRSAQKSDKPSKLTLPVFGLASYKFRGSLWRSDGQHEQHQLSSLLQKADDWLRLRQVEHPDYNFFISRYGAFRR
ncbi:hypothetical protein ZIOFF_037577 [Zingiber officinale]|uniref:Uncharacterized protein n=1 Tax=Zingiber officinale TaxID=94328 RepID=A0A8J5KZL5_ZINOF|nr:hypothetical protein ZIOFF_037577 [Zingiber officinale]